MCRVFFYRDAIMSLQTPFRLRDSLVPPIVVPLFLGFVVLAAVILR